MPGEDRVPGVFEGMVAAGLVLLACSIGATEEQLRARSAFDLNCPKSQLSIIEIDHVTRGVTGCGQRATYLQVCDQYAGCKWVLNSDSRPVPTKKERAQTNMDGEPASDDD